MKEPLTSQDLYDIKDLKNTLMDFYSRLKGIAEFVDFRYNEEIDETTEIWQLIYENTKIEILTEYDYEKQQEYVSYIRVVKE